MKQETQNKFAAILAAAQSKVNAIDKPNVIAEIKKEEPQQEIITPDEIKVIDEIAQPTTKSKMTSFYIHWSETTGKYDEQSFDTWSKANDAMRWIYKQHEGLGYTKTKITVKWDNGKEITDRVDCSDNNGDFSANREPIGEYLSKQKSVMYQSNLMQGERIYLSFEDEPQQDKPIYCAPVTFEVPAKKEDKPIEPKLQIIDYSDKAFAIIGDTKPIKDILNDLGGKFNAYLKCGAGWIFSKRQLDKVKLQLAL